MTSSKAIPTEAMELRKIIAELGYCTADASLEFMRLIPAEVRAALSKPSTDAGGLVKAVRSFRNAATEFRRAKNSGEQPRLSQAGTRHWLAEHRMFKALDALATQADRLPLEEKEE